MGHLEICSGGPCTKCSHGSGWLLLAQGNVTSHEGTRHTHDVIVRGSSSQSRIKSAPTDGAVTILAPGTRLRGTPPHEAHVPRAVAYRQLSLSVTSITPEGRTVRVSTLDRRRCDTVSWPLGFSLQRALPIQVPAEDRKSTCSHFARAWVFLPWPFSNRS